MTESKASVPHLPDVLIAFRIRQLIAYGRQQSQGDITCMRFGEIKLP